MILNLILHFLITVMLLCQDNFELNIAFPNQSTILLLCRDHFELNITFRNYLHAAVPR